MISMGPAMSSLDIGSMYGRRTIRRRARPTIGRYQLQPTPLMVMEREMDTEKGRLVMPRVTTLLTEG